MSNIVRTLLVVQISIVICLCIGLSPLSACAQTTPYNSPSYAEKQIFEKCSDELSDAQKAEFDSLTPQDRLKWLEANCVENKKSKRSKAWQMYVDCKPNLTPAQNKEFESKSWDDRKLFLATHCKHVFHPEPAETVKEKPAAVAKVQGQPKIAVFQIVNDADMDSKDVSTLDTIVERAVTEVTHDRYGIVVVEPPKEGEYCDDSCMLERAGINGATYAILGKLSSFAGGQVLSLELRKTDGAEVVASTVTDAVALEKLPGETRAAAELLISRSPFKKPATKSVAPAAFVPAKPQTSNWKSMPERSNNSNWKYFPQKPAKPPGYAGPRIAAHILFWMGIDLGIAGGTWLGIGAEEMGAGFIIVGGTFVIVAAICAGSYSKKKRERKEWNRRYGGQMYGGPIITPDFAGVGLVKNF